MGARARRPWLALLVVAAGLSECGQTPETHERVIAGTRIVSLSIGHAGASAPLLVWLHGRGGSPEKFTRFWSDLPDAVEVALPQGFDPQGFGWSWFAWPRGMTEDELAGTVGAAEERLWPAIAELARGRRLVVGGFSQGGVLAYVLAARHPDAIAAAFPVSGRVPGPLLPRGHAPTAPVYALHGTDDEIIEIGFARAAIAAFLADGATAELHEFPGVGHTITDAMRADLVAHMRAALVGPPGAARSQP